MPYYNSVSVNVKEATALAQVASLSRVAVFCPHAFSIEYSTPYYSIEDAVGLPKDSDAYKALQAGFLGAGSRTLPIYLSRVSVDEAVLTPVLEDSAEYSFTVTVYDTTDMSKELDEVEVSFTSASSGGTIADITAGLVADAGNEGITATDLNVSDATTSVEFTEPSNRVMVFSNISENLKVSFSTTETAATSFANLMSENSEDWYRATSTIRDLTWVKAMADVIEATESSDTPKIFRTSSASATSIVAQTDPSNSADILGVLEDANYRRTTAEWHDQSSEIFPEITHECYVGSFQEGTKGSAFNQNMSVPAARHPVLGRLLTKAEAGFITDRNATVRFKEFGLVITKTGKDGTSSKGQGQWIQNVVISDWTKLTMIQRGLTLLVNADNAGDPITFAQSEAQRMANTLNSVLEDGVASGLFTGYEPVQIPESFSFASQATRTLEGLTFKAFLAGAVHFVIVDGTLTYQSEDIEV
ncbi:tail sheath protein [Vibrio phage 1.187.O._10N.286.49.F1]|nr:tail sheath protein [Vibrio phage 1.187.O._10N.286.49.F1]